MRVTYVLTLERGGPLSHVLDLAPRVAAQGVDVSVVCADEAQAARFRAVGLDATPVTVRHKADLRGAAALARLLPASGVVHSHDRRAGLFARTFARARGAGVVHTYHGLPEEIAAEVGRADGAPPAIEASPARRLWLRHGYLRVEAALSRLGLVVVPSHAMRDYLIRRGLPAARMRVVPSGIDVIRAATAPRSTPLRLALLGNLEPWKGVDVAIAAIAATTVRDLVHLDVYGDGTQRATLEEQARRLDAPVTFHGYVADARDRVADADLLLVPSRAENLPVSILEAMAVAVPVVATRVGGIAELIDDGVTGRIVPPDDPTAMARAIASFAADEAGRVAAGTAGAARAAAQFDATAVATQLVEIYEEACASSR